MFLTEILLLVSRILPSIICWLVGPQVPSGQNPRWLRSCWEVLAITASVPTLVLSPVSEMLFLWEPQPKKRWRGSGIRTLVHTILCLPRSASKESLFLFCRPSWSLGALSLIWNLWSPCVWGQHWSTQPNLHLSSLSCITPGMGSDTW